MKSIVLGELVTAGGEHVTNYLDRSMAAMYSPLRHRSWVVPPYEIRSTQPTRIPLRFLGRDAGRVQHLQRKPNDGSVWAACELDDDVYKLLYLDRDHYLQATFVPAADGVEISAVDLVENRSKQIAQRTATVIRNGLDPSGRAAWRLPQFQRDLLEGAGRYRSWADTLIVKDARPDDEPTAQPMSAVDGFTRSATRVEYRSAASASVTGRELTVCVMPYNEAALVEVRGKMVEEVCSPRAFVGEEHRAERVKCNRDHDERRLVGRLTDLDPYDPGGLIATVRIAKTQLGDETLGLVEDDVLDCSAGFAVKPHGETWETASRRRLTSCLLHHLALVPYAAYDGARVLGVRQYD